MTLETKQPLDHTHAGFLLCGEIPEVVYFFTPQDYFLHFVALEVTAISGEFVRGAPLSLDQVDFQEKNAADGHALAATPNDATVLLEGQIKWDGCSDFDVGDNQEGSYRQHFCSRSGAGLIGRAIDGVYELATQTVPNWDETANGGGLGSEVIITRLGDAQ